MDQDSIRSTTLSVLKLGPDVIEVRKKLSVSESDPLAMFLYAIKSKETKEKYLKRLDVFFKFIEIDGTIQEKTNYFVSKARGDIQWAFANIMKFITYQKERADRGEISEAEEARMEFAVAEKSWKSQFDEMRQSVASMQNQLSFLTSAVVSTKSSVAQSQNQNPSGN